MDKLKKKILNILSDGDKLSAEQIAAMIPGHRDIDIIDALTIMEEDKMIKAGPSDGPFYEAVYWQDFII